MTVEVKDGNLIITMPIIKRMSSTGKNLLVASTGGSKVTSALVDGKPVTLGLNAYITP